MPSTVKAARVLLFLAAALTALVSVLFFYATEQEVSARLLGQLTWQALPGILSLWLGFWISRCGIGIQRWIIGVEVLAILQALGNLGQGDPRGLTNLILPIAIVFLVTRPSARRYFRRERKTA